MKKIAILTFDIDWIFAGGAKSGGASVVSKNLIFELAQNPNYEVTIFCKGNPQTNIENINIVSFEWKNLKTFTQEVEAELEKNHYDIILTTNLEYLNRNPIIQSQSFIHRCNNENFPINLIKKYFGRKKIKRQKTQFQNLDKNNKYIAVSKSVKDDYVKNFGLNPENVYVCHLGCKEIYETMPEIKKNDFITFGCVANNSINKGGHLFLLGLFALNLIGCNKFKAKIISKNKILKMISTILGLGKKVEFLPPQENIVDYYKSLDTLVLPSKNEAFGLVALETMSCGKPCIVSSTTGVAEIINKKENGLIFNRNSFLSFVLNLRKMYKMFKTEEYNKMSLKAFETSKLYTWANFVDNLIKNFE